MSDVATRNLAVGSEGFRVGRVLSKSLTILMGNFPKYILFGAIIALPNLISGFIASNRTATEQPVSPDQIFTAAPQAVGTFLVKWTVRGHRKATWRFDNGVGD